MVKEKLSPEQELIASPDDAEKLIERFTDVNMSEDEEAAAAFLLLIHSIVYTEQIHERENYLRTAERVVMLYTSAFACASKSLLLYAHDSLREVKHVE